MKTGTSFPGFPPGIPRPLLLAVILALPLAACHDGGGDDALAAPSSLGMIPGDGTVTLTWPAVPDADSYDLYWDTQAGLTKTDSPRIEGITTIPYTVTGMQNGDTFWFALASVQGERESRLSEEFSIALAPDAPGNITCSAGNGIVTLSWDEVYGATTYNLYRSTLPGVSKFNGDRIPDVTSPHDDLTVVNGTTYYYVIEAVGDGGAGPDSLQFSATPRDPLGAPTSPSVSLVDENPNTLEISWSPPTVGSPDSYNIYWDTLPGVTVGTNPIVDVTSPYIHTGLAGRTTYYYVVTAIQGGFESEASPEVSGTPRGSPGGGAGDEGLGNNLSFPLVFADGYGLTGLPIDGTVAPWLDYATGLRPTASEDPPTFPWFDPGSIHVLNGIDYFKQQTESTWQAEWRDGSSTMQGVVLNWGDNLSSASLKTDATIRVEVVLYQDDALDPMNSYAMKVLSGSGSNEVFGTSAAVEPSTVRNVFAINARLRIQKLEGPGGPVDTTLQGFDSSIYEDLGSDGPGAFGVEVNGAGAAVYGYVWRLRDWPYTDTQKRGWWRITFSLDPEATFGSPEVTLPNNVALVALDPGETIATLDTEENSSSIEFELVQ